MKILDININCFGGADNHREDFKEKYGYQYLKEWDGLDKSKEKNGILNCIKRLSPDIVIMQEYDINSKEARCFEREMEANGYVLESEKIEYRRPSMTIFYIKESTIPAHTYVSVGHTKNGRAYSIKVGDIIIYGTHVPPHYDEQFWTELHKFVENHMHEKYLLVGDFNTINLRNKNQFNRLLEGAIDIWKAKGNESPISIMGDYALISKTINLDNVDIDSFDDRYADHPAIVVSIE